MSYYNQNIEILERYNKKLYTAVKNYEGEEQQGICIKVYSSPAKDGSNALVASVDNMEYRFNSIYRPAQEAERWCSQFKFSNIGIVISMYGLGNGIFLRELINKKGSEDIVLIYEPSKEVFCYVIHNYDIADLIRNEKVLISVEGFNDEDFKDSIEKNIYWTNMSSQIVCMHPQYDKIFMKQSIKFLNIINENNNKTIINRNTNAFFGRDMVENTIKNLKFINNAITVSDLSKEDLKNVPAIIVSAGPSLDKNLHLLKKAKGKAFIVATDTAMKFLYAHDIIPDCFVTLDALKPESYLDDPRFMEIPLFCKVESNWRILYKHKARKIYYSCHGYMEQLYKKLDKQISEYTSGGSVATGAFSICAEMKFKHIILIGQDLAFAGDRTHAGELSDHIHGEEEGVRYVEGIDGNPVKTRHDWYIYLQWFEESIQMVKDFVEVIDATEGGAKIHGTKIMTLEEAITQYCKEDFNFAELLGNKTNTLSEEQINQFYETMVKGVGELADIQKKTLRAEKYCEEIVESLNKDAVLNDLIIRKSEELEKINLEIECYLVYKLIDDYMSDVSIHALSELYKLTGDEETDRINTYKRAGVFYQLIASAVNAIKPMLEEAVATFWRTDNLMIEKKEKNIVIIIQARVGSTRLKGKVMRNLAGKSILAHDIERIRQARFVNDIVIATTTKEQDDIIVKEAQKLGVKVFRGSEDDVLSRYYYSAKETRADIIVRVTSDCPLIDPGILDQTVQFYLNNQYDIVTNAGIELDKRTFPRGLDVEVFSYDMIRLAYQYAKERYQREHVTPYLYENRTIGYYCSDSNNSRYRWTLDTEEDWELISEIYKHLYHGKHNFYYQDILDLMEKYPELQYINNEIEQKKLK
jgi:spore coat polysaccharide biosynthesis protein SpsF (cytidylyltransferase family)